MTNLLENALQAVDAIDAGGSASAARHGGEQIALDGADNGRGMPPDVVARLFEPFFTTRSRRHRLGLAIARGVARAHGGGIDVRSEPGVGTEFIITLPLSRRRPCPKA